MPRKLVCLCVYPTDSPFKFSKTWKMKLIKIVREQNKLTVDQMPPACNLAACLGLSGTASCIVSALGSGDPAALQRCLVNGLSQV